MPSVQCLSIFYTTKSRSLGFTCPGISLPLQPYFSPFSLPCFLYQPTGKIMSGPYVPCMSTVFCLPSFLQPECPCPHSLSVEILLLYQLSIHLTLSLGSLSCHHAYTYSKFMLIPPLGSYNMSQRCLF